MDYLEMIALWLQEKNKKEWREKLTPAEKKHLQELDQIIIEGGNDIE